jgi:DNA-binding transcriptional MerR regulator
MTTYTISALGKTFGLSRSTLLYYDRIGLLSPSGRTPAGYRFYTDREARKLQRICHFRNAGLKLDQIQTLLAAQDPPNEKILKARLQEIGDQIQSLKIQQVLLASMLERVAQKELTPNFDKQMWVEMLQAAGMDECAMEIWHGEFERRSPNAHHQFLVLLNIEEEEIVKIRKWSTHISGEITVEKDD